MVPPTWAEMERVLSGRPRHESQFPGDGGDSPAWSRKRGAYLADGAVRRSVPPFRTPSCTPTRPSASSTVPARPRNSSRKPCGSGWTRSRSPTTTACTAWSGSPRAAKELGMRTVFGAELSLDATPRTGTPDPGGTHLLVLARGQEGYRRLSRQIAAAHLAGGRRQAPTTTTRSRRRRAGTGRSSPGAARGTCAVHSPRRVPTPPKLRCATSSTGSGRSGHRRTHPSRPAGGRRDQRGARGNRHATAASRDRVDCGALRRSTPTTAGDGAMAAVRARQSLDEAAGWLAPTGGAAPAVRGRDGAAVRAEVPRRGGRRRAGGSSARSTCGSSRRNSRRSTSRTGTRKRAGCAS